MGLLSTFGETMNSFKGIDRVYEDRKRKEDRVRNSFFSTLARGYLDIVRDETQAKMLASANAQYISKQRELDEFRRRELTKGKIYEKDSASLDYYQSKQKYVGREIFENNLTDRQEKSNKKRTLKLAEDKMINKAMRIKSQEKDNGLEY